MAFHCISIPAINLSLMKMQKEKKIGRNYRTFQRKYKYLKDSKTIDLKKKKNNLFLLCNILIKISMLNY